MPGKRKLPMNWSPLKFAEDSINDLRDKIKICNGTDTSLNAASVFGNLEAAFYEKEINEDRMNEMKDNIRRLLFSFNEKCKCQLK
jgi:hypothetical protein